MKKLLLITLVLALLAPAMAKNMAEGKFSAGVGFGNGVSMLCPGNAWAAGINLQYTLPGIAFQGYFDYHLALQPEADDLGDATESIMDFGLDILGVVGDGPFVGYTGVGFFYMMSSLDMGVEGVDAIDMSTLGLNWSAGVDYFLTDLIALGFEVNAPISLSSDDGGEDDYNGAANAAGLFYKSTVKFFF